MAIDVEWQDERGDTLATYEGPPINAQFVNSTPLDAKCICFIDPYGDTTFNAEQVSVLEGELESLAGKDVSVSEQARALLHFLASHQDRVHTYLKFIGD